MANNKFSKKPPILEFIISFLIDLVVIIIVILGVHTLCFSIEWLYTEYPLEPNGKGLELTKTYWSINLTRSLVTITDLVSIAMICIIGITNVFKFAWMYIESFVIYWRFICKRCKENGFSLKI